MEMNGLSALSDIFKEDKNEMWKDCFDIRLTAAIGEPVFNIIKFDEWLHKRFSNYTEDMSMGDCFQKNIDTKYHEVLKKYLLLD